MNAYYLTAVITCTQIRSSQGRYGPTQSIQTWDGCPLQIVFGRSAEDAQEQFEAWLRAQPEGENPKEVIIRKIAAVPFVDQWLTESGKAPLDWLKILKQADTVLQATPVDDFEQGYWVDVDQVVRPERLSFSAGTLESDVPEDIRSGLNWSADRKFFFLVNVLPSPPPPKPFPAVEAEERGETTDEDSEQLDPAKMDELNAIFPETVALIQARNSVIAAWLWRRYAANTRLASNAIRITPFCGTLGEVG
jgi:hypothetical protein